MVITRGLVTWRVCAWMQMPHQGGDRIHVTVKKFKGDVDAALNKVSKTTGASLMAIQRTLTTTLVRRGSTTVPSDLRK